MVETIPAPLVASLSQKGLAPNQILLAVKSDLNLDGRYRSEWLIATQELIYVMEQDRPAEPLRVFELREVKSARTLSAVGSGYLQLMAGEDWVTVIRFSNRLRFNFDQTVKRLEQILRGEIPLGGPERDPQRCPTCGVMLTFAGERCPRCLKRRTAVRRMGKMIQPYWRTGMVLVGVLLVGNAMDMAWPLLTRYLVDDVLSKNPPGAHEVLISVVGLLALVHSLRAGVNVVSSSIAARVGNALTHDVRTQLLAKLEALDLSYYTKQETGSLVGRVAYDTEAINNFMGQITSGFVMQFVMVTLSVIMMFVLEPSLAYWAMLPAPFVIAGSVVYWRYIHPRFQRYWHRTSQQAGLLNSILTGIRVVKAFGREEYEYGRFDEASLTVSRAKNELDQRAAYFYPLMGIVFQVGGWIIWYVGGLSVLGADISLGTLMAFFGYLSMFYGPLGNLTNLTTWLTQFSTQIHRIVEILDAPKAIADPESPAAAGAGVGEIAFRDVSFSYLRGMPVLQGVSLHIKPGERIGVVGRSGSGKTSLINLICRFYDVDGGSIFIDGVDIRLLSKDGLHRQISLVLQEPLLFRGTLAENIAYGDLNAGPDAILEAGHAASSHQFIMNQRLAYDTSVGERGQELSGGERQRISIARALLRPAPILILDEATSSVDTESEMAIQAALNRLSGKRTILSIAHRLSTLQNCDRIYVIDAGRIAEAGNHGELMAMDGLYAKWVKLQNMAEDTQRSLNTEAVEAFTESQLRWLTPDNCEIRAGKTGELQLRLDGGAGFRGVFAARCFPVRHGENYLSLSTVAGPAERPHELGIIRKLEEFPPAARDLIRRSLRERYFFHLIQKLYSIRRTPGFLTVKVLTDLGQVEFTLRDTPDSTQSYGKAGKLFIDVEDCFYILDDVGKLTAREREIYERHIYW